MKKMLLICFLTTIVVTAKNYTKNSETVAFIDDMVQRYDCQRSKLEDLFSDVVVQNDALNAFLPPSQQRRTNLKVKPTPIIYPKEGTWDRYVKYKVTPQRIEQGIAFIHKYQNVFSQVEKQFGIPKEYIAAIIGIETVYGGNVGKYPVFDTLTTLSFEKNRRNKFFQKELREFLYLSKLQKFNPKDVYGSYAGAIGLGQFMPSNCQAYGVDFNCDGQIMMHHPEDAIASVANYLKKNGWRKGEPIATRVRYAGTRFRQYKTGYDVPYYRKHLKGIEPREPWGYNDKVRLIKLDKEKYDELWYGAKNFFVITRYNHSGYYAMAVHQLATQIALNMRK
jgi:membrane-bound lytic murein transglycosylase B